MNSLGYVGDDIKSGHQSASSGLSFLSSTPDVNSFQTLDLLFERVLDEYIPLLIFHNCTGSMNETWIVEGT